MRTDQLYSKHTVNHDYQPI